MNSLECEIVDNMVWEGMDQEEYDNWIEKCKKDKAVRYFLCPYDMSMLVGNCLS